MKFTCCEPQPQDNKVQKWPVIYTGGLLFHLGLCLHEQSAQPELSSAAKESLLRTQRSRYLCFRDFTLPRALAWSDVHYAHRLVELVFWLS